MHHTTNMRLLMESMTLTEGYEDRIAQAATILSGKSKNEILKQIESDVELAQNGHISELLKALPELRLKSKTASEAKRDLLAYMSKNKILGRAKPTSVNRAPYYVMSNNSWDEKRIPVSHDDITELGRNLLSWAGESFPDGDPNDQVMQWMERKGWDVGDAYDRIMPIACKKYIGTKTYNAYLAQLWDDVFRDARFEHSEWANHDPKTRGPEPEMFNMLGGDSAQNPWK